MKLSGLLKIQMALAIAAMLAIGAGPEFISFAEGAGRLGGRDRIDHFGFGMIDPNAAAQPSRSQRTR